MSICLPFLLYVCGFFSKDHAYTSIEDSMAIGDPRVVVIFENSLNMATFQCKNYLLLNGTGKNRCIQIY